MRSRLDLLLFSIILFISSVRLCGQGACGTVSCSVCDVSATITSISGGTVDNAISTISGNTNPGGTETSDTPLAITASDCGVITINVELDFDWNQGDQINWIHGISFENSAGWLAAEGVIIPPDPGWLFFDEMTGVCSNTTYDAGFYWDPPGSSCNNSGNLSSYNGNNCNNNAFCEADDPHLVNGDPSDNWGIDCETDCPQFGFSLTYCPAESGTTDEVITFILTEDGETGGWSDSDGCIFSLSFPITINAAGVQLPEDDIGPICQEDCVTIDAGSGCDNYIWNTGETTPTITVCPTETTTYAVTVSSDLGCETSGDVTVLVESCCEADAGVIISDPVTLCPGEVSTITVTDYQSLPSYSQLIIIADDNGVIIDIIHDDQHQLSSDICAVYTVYSYNYLTSGNSTIPFIGQDMSMLDCQIHCCDLEKVVITFTDTESPIFSNPPGDISIACIDDLPEIENLEWTDNCILTGISIGEEIQNYNLCEGGEITRIWTAADSCQNESVHTQTISILPILEPEFSNPPLDIYLFCGDVVPEATSLSFSNGQSGTCLISGQVNPTIETDTSMCGGTISYQWQYLDDCGRLLDHEQIITLAPPTPPIFIDPPSDIFVSCGEDAPSTIDLIVTNNQAGHCLIQQIISPSIDNQTDACGGTIIYNWVYENECGHILSHSQTITIAPAPEAVFIDPPADITLSCSEVQALNPSLLTYSNSDSDECLIYGEVLSTQDGEIDVCGGVLMNIWTFTDDCGRSIKHIQNVEVEPAPQATYTDVPPPYITVDCNDVPTPTALEYSNGMIGGCAINGIATGIISGTYNACGGQLLQSWISTDDCGNVLSYVQEIEVLSAPDPIWINPPSDITIDCEEDFPSPSALEYSNSTMGSCAIQGYEDATIVEGDNTVEYSWNYTNLCTGFTLTHTQLITRPIPPDILVQPSAFTGCQGDLFDLNTLSVTDLNGDILDLQYFDENGNIITDLELVISHDMTITIIGTNEDGCSDEAVFQIYMDVPLILGDGVGMEYCPGGGLINLYDYLEDPIIYGGIWDDSDDSGALIDDPFASNFEGVPAGSYMFEYIVPSSNSCSDQSVILEVEVHAIPVIELVSSVCNDDWTFYNIEILTFGHDIVSSSGSVLTINMNTVIIENIPIEDVVSISVTDPISSCTNEYTYSPPICDCPDIDPPVSDGDHIICEGEDNPTISVAVANGFTVNWYDAPVGGNLLLENSLTFSPLHSDPGIYSYFAEAINEDGCSSFVRSEIIFEIISNPEANGVEITQCANENGISIFQLADINSLVNDNSSLEFQYYYNQEDAITGLNEIEDEYLTSANTSQLIVKVTNDSGCTTYATVSFIVNPLVDFEIVLMCNDNGTTTDGSDDYYTITISAEQNGSPNLTYDVLVDGLVEATFSYSDGGVIQWPADGQSHTVILNDESDIHCFAEQNIDPLVPCSDDCTIAVDFDLSCINGGTIGITDDDTYALLFTGSGTNNSASGYSLILDGEEMGTYYYGDNQELNIAADGQSHHLIFTDADDSECSVAITTEDLLPCSGMCTVEGFVISTDCNNNDSALDTSDDTFMAEVMATIMEGTGTWIIEPEGITGISGDTISIGPFDIGAGDVLLTISDANIPSCSTTIIVPAPQPCSICEEFVDAGEGGTLDCEITSIDLEGISSIPGDAMWDGPGGMMTEGYTVTADISGVYYFSVDFGDGCIVIDSLLISTSNDIPVADAGPDAMITCDTDMVLLTGNVSGGGTNLQYTWYDQDGNILGNSLEIAVSEAGNYFFEVLDLDTECTSPRDVTTVTDKTGGPVAIIYANPGEILDCVIEVIYITNQVEQDVVYTWTLDNQPVTTPNIIIDQPSDIHLQAVDTITGCTSDASLIISSLEEYPIINVVSSGELSCENEEIIINGSLSQSGDDITYIWYDENLNVITTNMDEILVTETGTYYLELMDSANGCTNIDTVVVEGAFDYPIISESEEFKITCTQNEMTIGVDVVGESDLYGYKWSTENGNIIGDITDSTAFINQEGTYYVTVLDPASGCISLDTISVLPPEEILATDIQVIDENCDTNADGEFILGEVIGGTAPYTLVFNGLVQPDNVVGSLSAGTYNFTIFDVNGCRLDTNATITVLDPFQLDINPNIIINTSETITLTVEVDIAEEDIDSISWSPTQGLSCDNCLITQLDGSLAADEYTVTITDIYGCKNETTVRVTVESNTKVTFPNIISTNGDGNNDRFTVYTDDADAQVLTMKIFDRWGEMVFTQESFLPNNIVDGWDGTFKGRPVAQGVYMYVVEMDLEEGRKIFSGDLTVIW